MRRTSFRCLLKYYNCCVCMHQNYRSIIRLFCDCLFELYDKKKTNTHTLTNFLGFTCVCGQWVIFCQKKKKKLKRFCNCSAFRVLVIFTLRHTRRKISYQPSALADKWEVWNDRGHFLFFVIYLIYFVLFSHLPSLWSIQQYKLQHCLLWRYSYRSHYHCYHHALNPKRQHSTKKKKNIPFARNTRILRSFQFQRRVHNNWLIIEFETFVQQLDQLLEISISNNQTVWNIFSSTCTYSFIYIIIFNILF